MNPRLQIRILIVAVSLLLAGSARTQAQWLTQTLSLKAGWNAVFLHVDASHQTIDELVGSGAPVLTPIEQVWRWNPNPATGQFVISPQEPIDTGSQWTSWKRSDTGPPKLERLSANSAYLVYSTSDFTWEIKGVPALPVYRWSTSGLNFFGFPSVTDSPPNLLNFLSPVPALLTGEIFRYPGGALGAGNPQKITDLRVPARRGEAYWLRSGEMYNQYYGPFEVVSAGSGKVAFGDALSVSSFRLKNLTTGNLTVTLQVVASEVAPVTVPPQAPITGVPPLLLRGERDITSLTYGVLPLVPGTPRSWTLAPRGKPGSEAEVVLGLDRAAMGGTAGDLLAGVLRLTDSLGYTRVDMGVSAVVGSSAGLWVGQAMVTEVGQYLQSYLRDGNNQPVLQSDGTYVVTGVVTDIKPVPAPFPLRIILHNPASGAATLLQRVYAGFNAAAVPIVANQESALERNLISTSRRLSASHLPWSEANPGWPFSGALRQGAAIKADVTTAFNQHESNPFLHTYHPDHDNLNVSFKNELPQGAESYTILREITLNVTPPGTDFASRVAAGQTLIGDYLETIRVQGLARAGNTFDARRFDVRGGFKLNRISEIPTLTRVP